MLDQDLKEQLRTHFAGLEHNIELVADASDHAQQAELMEMLNGLAETSDKITARVTDTAVAFPQFAVHRDGAPTGIRFHGIPGGHEFTSLILAILNSAGRGKLPDAGLTQRVRKLKRAAIRTYVSLTCENCPDVVQALNQIALSHGGLQHTMIDGGFVQEELTRLNVLGVPAVFVGDTLVHSGRATLAELLTKLEAVVGQDAAAQTQATDLGRYDVAVIGGGPAGVAAAIYSVRKGLKTALLTEKIGGQVQETKGIENFISVAYTEGQQLTANLDQHLRSYPVDVLEHRRVQQVTNDAGVSDVRLDSGEHLRTDALIVATGAQWRQLGVPGEKEHIGRGVAFCAHCDGPLYKGKKVAVVGGGNSGVEAAIDLSSLCTEITLLEFAPELKADEVLVKKLRALPNVTVVTNAATTEILGNGEKVVAMTYRERAGDQEHRVELDGVFVQIGLSPNSAIVKDLVELTRYGEIVVDAKGRTSVPGIYAAGDVTTVPFKQIVIAMGDGAKAALTAFEDRMRKTDSSTASPETTAVKATTTNEAFSGV